MRRRKSHRQTLGSQSLDNSIPTLLKGLDSFFQFFIFAFSSKPFLFITNGDHGRQGRRIMGGNSELPVLLFKLGDSPLEIREMGFPFISGILGCDAIAMGPCLAALVAGQALARSWALALWARLVLAVVREGGRVGGRWRRHCTESCGHV